MASGHNRIISPQAAQTSLRDYSLYLNYGQPALLPDEHSMVLNSESGHFTLIDWSVRCVIEDGQLSLIGELPLMLALLDAWPSYVPTEKLLQAVTKRSAEEIAQLLDIAHDETLEPLGCFVDACRERLHDIGIDIEEQVGIEDQGVIGYKLGHKQQGGRS